MPAPKIQRQPTEEEEEEKEIQTKPLGASITPYLQRQAKSEEEEEEEVPLQTRASPYHTAAVSPNIQTRLQSLKGGGQPLPINTRSFFEARMGRDFLFT